MHKLLKILLAGLVCLGSMAPAFADESAGVLPCTLTAENGTPVWQLSDQNRSTKLELVMMAQELLEKYNAKNCARLVMEAAEVYEKRGILR